MEPSGSLFRAHVINSDHHCFNYEFLMINTIVGLISYFYEHLNCEFNEVIVLMIFSEHCDGLPEVH